MSNVLEVRHLRLIRCIAEEGSLARAAGRLHLTPSALSHQLRAVEKRLNVALFHRVGRRLALSDAGCRVLGVAEEVLDGLDRAERRIGEIAKGAALLRIGCDCYTGYAWAAPILKVYATSRRGVDVEMAPQTTRRGADALLKGEIDLTLTPVAIQDTRLEQAALFEEEMVAVLSADHPLAVKPYLEPADFADVHALPHTCDDLVLKNYLHTAGIIPRPVTTVMVTESVCALARAGAGVGVLGRWSVAPFRKDAGLKILGLGRAGQRRLWRAIGLRERMEAESIQDLVGFLLKLRVGESGPAAPMESRRVALDS